MVKLKKEMTKKEILYNLIPFVCGFIALGIIIILVRTFENEFTYNYDWGVLYGFTEGIFLIISLFLWAKYQELKERD